VAIILSNLNGFGPPNKRTDSIGLMNFVVIWHTVVQKCRSVIGIAFRSSPAYICNSTCTYTSASFYSSNTAHMAIDSKMHAKKRKTRNSKTIHIDFGVWYRQTQGHSKGRTVISSFYEKLLFVHRIVRNWIYSSVDVDFFHKHKTLTTTHWRWFENKAQTILRCSDPTSDGRTRLILEWVTVFGWVWGLL